MASSFKRLGDVITLVDERNADGSVTNLLGVSIDKHFMPSVANVIGTDLTKYKVVRRNRFACSLMQVSRDHKMPISRYDADFPSIISPAYVMFELTSDGVLPEYLELWTQRAEFDREADFYAVGGVRGNMTWDELQGMSLVVPPIEEQRAIVARHRAIDNRINALRRLNDKLASCAEAIFADAFLGTEREMAPITQFATIGAGGDKPTPCVDEPTAECCIPVYSNGIENDGLYGYTNRAKARAGSTTISARGTIGYVCLRTCDYVPIVRLISVTPKKGVSSHYLYLYLRTLHIEGVGSTQQQLTAPMVKGYNVPLASADEMATFDEKVKPLFDLIDQTRTEIALLQELKQGMLTEIAGAVG